MARSVSLRKSRHRRHLCEQRSRRPERGFPHTATFVLRPDTERDSFGFAHTSLQEFFLAAFLVRAIEEHKLDRWSMPRASWETFEFIGQLLQVKKLEARRLNHLLETGEIRAATQAFGYWVTAIKRGYPQPDPSVVTLPNADLEEWRIENIRLKGANLAGAQLNRARLQNVDLSGADLTGTSAREAVFMDVTAEGPLADGGGLGYPEWRNSGEPSYSLTRWKGVLANKNLGLARVGGQWTKASGPT